MRKWSLFGLVAAVAFGPMLMRAEKMPAQTAQPGTQAKQAPVKGERAQEFITAFNRGDAKALAGFWVPDGDYVDQVGRQIKGRAAIEKLYEQVFAARKGAKLAITVTSARQVTSDVAIEDGITEVTPADGGPGTAARFTAVLVKKDGVWYFESVRESEAQPPSNAEHLEDLEWLIGDWTGESEKGESAKAAYAWAENQNFIVSSFATTLNGIPVIGGTQWIGWDAVDKQIRSWSFYSGGGHGEAVWTKDGGKWSIKVTARTADGKKVSATNLLTKVDDDHAVWQVTRLTVDGQSIPDSQPVKLKRVNPEQP
jgi:uncharacterized protein (TIGR02246 family)